MVLVSGSTATMRRIGSVQNLGVFFNPKSRHNYRHQVVPDGMPWGADNAAFTGFSGHDFELMLDTLDRRRLPGCLFVTVPDVVSNAKETLGAFWRWRPQMARYDWPLAFVAQDGLTVRTAPWRFFDVLFIGGSTRWKLGQEAWTLCGYAKALGKRVHVGRVNSDLRAGLFAGVADTIDGTATSRYGNVYIPEMLRAARRRSGYVAQRAFQVELAL